MRGKIAKRLRKIAKKRASSIDMNEKIYYKLSKKIYNDA